MTIELNDEVARGNLTPEELAAIQDPEYSEGELAAMKAVAGPDDDSDDDGADEVLDADGKPVETTTVVPPAENKTAPPADTKPAEKPADPPIENKAPAPSPAPVVDPAYQAKLPDDYKAQVDALKTQATDIEKQFTDGVIDFEAYKLKMGEITDQRETLSRASVKAEISQEMSQQQAQRAWANTLNTAIDRAVTADGIDYRKDPAKNKDLDTFIKVLAADDANEAQPMAWFVEEAHKRVKALYGIVGQAAPTPAPTPAPAPAKRGAPDLKAVPLSLATVPGGDGPGDVSGDSFASLDALEGNDLEAAIAKLTPAERERYARMA